MLDDPAYYEKLRERVEIEFAPTQQTEYAADEPVSIEPRTLVPRVIRDDNRYKPDLKDAADG